MDDFDKHEFNTNEEGGQSFIYFQLFALNIFLETNEEEEEEEAGGTRVQCGQQQRTNFYLKYS